MVRDTLLFIFKSSVQGCAEDRQDGRSEACGQGDRDRRNHPLCHRHRDIYKGCIFCLNDETGGIVCQYW